MGQGSTASIACIAPLGPYHGRQQHAAAIISGVDAVCHELGYRLYITTTVQSALDERRALRWVLDTGGASGVILYPLEGDENTDLLAELRARRIPFVLVDRYRPDLPTDAVVADNFAVGYRVTDHLIRSGHRSIATLWSEVRCTSVRDRLVGHVQACIDHGVPIRPDLTALRSFLFRPDDERRAMLLELLALNDPPTVLLCANGDVLTEAVHDLLTLDVAMPERVDLASLDDQAPFNLVPFAAATALLPAREVGVRAMRLLADRVLRGVPYADPQHVVLPVEFRTRNAGPGHLRAVRTTA